MNNHANVQSKHIPYVSLTNITIYMYKNKIEFFKSTHSGATLPTCSSPWRLRSKVRNAAPDSAARAERASKSMRMDVS